MGGPIVFGPFTFDPEARELRRNGNMVRLQDQPAQVLGALLERHGHVVTREELQHLLWPDGTFVDFDQSLNKAVTKLRDALHDDADRPRYIETIPRRGYRFIAPITTPEPAPVSVATPPRRFALVGVALSLAAVAAASLWLFLASRPAPIASIAVLPFENLTGDPQYEPEADALTEALISRLAQVSSFKRVISRTSVVQYKGTKKPLPEIARSLRVDAIVEGALTHSGGRVRATARLFNAQEEAPIWSRSYDRPSREIQMLQAEMAIDVLKEARAVLSPEENSRTLNARTVDPEAYRAFVFGRHLCWQYDPESKRNGYSQLRLAIAKAPDFAEAYGAIALCGCDPKETAAATDKALELDPLNSDAYASRGLWRMYQHWDWIGAEQDLRRSVQFAPSNAGTHANLAFYLTVVTRFDEALREIERAIDVNPADYLFHHHGSGIANKARLPSLAVEYGRRASSLNNASDLPHQQLCWAFTALGRLHEAAESCGRVMQRWPLRTWEGSDIWVLPYLVVAGRRQEAEITLAYWERRLPDGVDPYNLACMQTILGHHENALGSLERAFEQHSASLSFLKCETLMDPIRSHPRYLALLKKMNFPE